MRTDAAPTAASEGASRAETARAPFGKPADAALPTPGARADSDGPVLVLGGDVSFARSVGQRLLSDPGFDPFAGIDAWLAAGDLRAVNLESVLSDQGGSTEHPQNPLVFSGPPLAAGVLSRKGIDLVSVANNHAWDYGKRGLFESLEHLARAGVSSSGASRTAGAQTEPVVVERAGVRFAFLAFTQVWNDGELTQHPAARHVARDDYEVMKRALARARQRADFVVVSLHASNEYVALPRERARSFARGALISGADLVFGHHPHVVQGVEWLRGKPIFYSLGNLLFASKRKGPEPPSGALARVRLSRSAGARELAVAGVELCPVDLPEGLPVPGDAAAFAERLGTLSKPLGGLEAQLTERGCVEVVESESPLPDALRRGFRPTTGASGAQGQARELKVP